ncbi:MAG: DUF5681 domain-containing protein [Pseudomonadota bacterium]
MIDRNSGPVADGRNSDGTFAKGNPGRPKGTRLKVTRAVEELLEGQAEALSQKAVELALGGDTTALRLCIERIAPVRKDSPVEFDLPEMTCAEEAALAASAVLKAVSQADLTPLEGASLMGLIEQYRRTLETTQIEKRLQALEQSR